MLREFEKKIEEPKRLPPDILPAVDIGMVIEIITKRNRQERTISGQIPEHLLSIKIGDLFTDLETVARVVIDELARENLSAKKLRQWIINWGMVRVSANAEEDNSAEIVPLKAHHNLVPLATKRNLLSGESFNPLRAEGKVLSIIVNEQKTTEGTVVAISHLVEETILELVKRNGQNFDDDQFTLAAIALKELPIRVFLAENDEQLARFFLEHQDRCFGRTLGRQDGPFNSFLGLVCLPTEESPTPTKEKETERVGVVSVSGGKRFHLGHGLSLTRAQLETESVVLRNNNIGPRFVEMIKNLMSQKDLGAIEAIRLLKEMTPTEIETLWKTRSECPSDLEFERLIAREGDVVEPLTRLNKRDAFSLWDQLQWLDDSSIVKQLGLGSILDADDTSNPKLVRAGLVITRNGVVLSRGGCLSVQGADLVVGKILTERFSQVVFFDSSPTTKKSVGVMQGREMSVQQKSGLGVMIGDEIGSGTSGNLPSINELLAQFSPRELRQAMGKIVLHDWLLHDPKESRFEWWVADRETAIKLLWDFSKQPRDNEALSTEEMVFEDSLEMEKIRASLRQRERSDSTKAGIHKINLMLTQKKLPPEFIRFLNSHGLSEEKLWGEFSNTILKPVAERIVAEILIGKRKLVKNPFLLQYNEG